MPAVSPLQQVSVQISYTDLDYVLYGYICLEIMKLVQFWKCICISQCVFFLQDHSITSAKLVVNEESIATSIAYIFNFHRAKVIYNSMSSGILREGKYVPPQILHKIYWAL